MGVNSFIFPVYGEQIFAGFYVVCFVDFGTGFEYSYYKVSFGGVFDDFYGGVFDAGGYDGGCVEVIWLIELNVSLHRSYDDFFTISADIDAICWVFD